ncbi:hypothetical protein [Maritimibacter dapengensis]|uniref:Uncharacterized protein n=1 Tax=Maritimibacter dapengensis TaxID=2836868 RepID=A0ABS6SZ94_9RHOB|nr:hypothetical protein [Maritimibacter dapengensis]MBV7378294.1 hypothetical protein [Maritimibacter dapengensis]
MKALYWIVGAALVAALVATAAPAEPQGCYTRHYSENHLAEHPEQLVANIWVEFSTDTENGGYYAGLGVTTVEGGHVAGTDLADGSFEQGLVCYGDRNPVLCAVDCDGGSFEVVRDTFESIDIRTVYLMVGDTEGCGGAVDISEGPGKPTTYRLFKSPPEGCVVN